MKSTSTISQLKKRTRSDDFDLDAAFKRGAAFIEVLRKRPPFEISFDSDLEMGSMNAPSNAGKDETVAMSDTLLDKLKLIEDFIGSRANNVAFNATSDRFVSHDFTVVKFCKQDDFYAAWSPLKNCMSERPRFEWLSIESMRYAIVKEKFRWPDMNVYYCLEPSVLGTYVPRKGFFAVGIQAVDKPIDKKEIANEEFAEWHKFSGDVSAQDEFYAYNNLRQVR